MPKKEAIINNSQALYRKHRPKEFDSVLGQEHIVLALSKAIELGNISHAYLFAGSRGTGKTSVARIFASEIKTSPNDLYEIDAASNRGIDDIRELRDGVGSLPFESKYKVYIIDEVHMLTKEAFNALLKTLEEPPEHVIFILATTEIEKIPDTIISRCQVFNFRRPTQQILKEMALNVAKKEGIQLEPASAELISLLGDGSFRDTLSALQKALSISSDKKISHAEVEQVLGAPKNELVNKLLLAIEENKLSDALATVKQLMNENAEVKHFYKMLLQKVRYVLLLRFNSTSQSYIKEAVGEDDLKLFEDLSQSRSGQISANLLEQLLANYEFLGKSILPELPLELALMKVLVQKS